MDVDEYPPMDTALELDPATSGEDEIDCPLEYKDTLQRLKEAKNDTQPSPLSITLTPSVSTDSIVLLSTTPLTPTSETSYSVPSSGRSTPSVSFSDKVEIFEIPKRDDIENQPEEEMPISHISCISNIPRIHKTHSEVDSIPVPEHGLSSTLDRTENGNSAGDPPITPKSKRAFAGILGGISPRPKRKTEADGNLDKIRFDIQRVDSDTLSEALSKISGIANGLAPGTISSEVEVDKNVLRDKKGLKREDTLIDECDDAQGVKENKAITGILKGGGIDHSNRAIVMLICEDSGIQFDTRCLRLAENDEAKIGRCIKAGGTLPDKTNGIFECKVLSRQHASISYKDGSFFLRDLKSSNGTYLIQQGNEAPTPIDKSMANRTLEIFSGDVLQFGQDVYEGPRSDSSNNDDDQRDQQNVNKCIRARLKLYHPSQQECKTRCCADSDTGTEGYSSDGEEIKNNRISLDRSDSLVIHDVPETIPIHKKEFRIDSSHQPAEQSSSNAVHSLLQSIRDETEKYLVTQEGNSDRGKSPSLIHSDILDKLETLERLMVAATHTAQSKSSKQDVKDENSGLQAQDSQDTDGVQLRKVKGRSKTKRDIDDSTLVKRPLAYPKIELKGDLRGCVEKCREIAGIGAAVVAHDGADNTIENMADLAKAVTEKIKELEIRLKNEESSVLNTRLSVLERRTEVSYAMIKCSNTAITYISIFFAMIAILFLIRDGIRENHRRLTAW